MATIVILLLISLFHCSVPYPRCVEYPWNKGCHWEDISENGSICPDGQSLLSTEDIAEMIDYIAAHLYLESNIINEYHMQLQNASKKYVKAIEEFHKQLQDRPKHIKHILEEMAEKRHRIESKVNLISEKIQDIGSQKERLQEASERSDTFLVKIEMFKRICKINCEDVQYYDRYRSTRHLRSLTRYHSNSACWKIRDLYNEIKDQLNVFYAEMNREISNTLYNIDDICSDYIHYYKMAWKQAAIERFATIMYDILSLQDDYYHYAQLVSVVNESRLFDDLEENISNIENMLETLESDVDKYGINCMNCHNSHRYKRDIFPYDSGIFLAIPHRPDTNTFTQGELDSLTIDDLIHMKIEEIRRNIANEISEIFEGLDAHISAKAYIDRYIDELLPTDEIAYDIQKEQEAFNDLKRAVSNSPLKNLIDLVGKSEVILVYLEDAKDYLYQVEY